MIAARADESRNRVFDENTSLPSADAAKNPVSSAGGGSETRFLRIISGRVRRYEIFDLVRRLSIATHPTISVIFLDVVGAGSPTICAKNKQY